VFEESWERSDGFAVRGSVFGEKERSGCNFFRVVRKLVEEGVEDLNESLSRMVRKGLKSRVKRGAGVFRERDFFKDFFREFL